MDIKNAKRISILTTDIAWESRVKKVISKLRNIKVIAHFINILELIIDYLILLISGISNICLPYGGTCDRSFDNGRCIPRPCNEKCLFSHQCGPDDNICHPNSCNYQSDCYPSESCSKILSGSLKKLTPGCIPNKCKRDSGDDDNHYWNNHQ